ncbi:MULTISPECIES: DUF4406 domain-containing protein [Vibrio harveyi group]|uniref:DUF4406 domain-containing protein n=1 Tax=Vibrio harveyi group TaxID=717610 RepID=UPI0011105993|nr:DUF4406 domain-containing protein [Vibrio parahaemolyticus]MDG2761586.1 DUF4406 domain-containing protein [Vibrio parahaemolyticus]TMX40834.1 nucleoside 2-deoxyribosyltransferase [Vibrio parahaemolyticus]TMX79861.1 nucleoside 2-deoxyribosyltransferase [Vibrio parahaemolyticus]
MKIYIAGGVTDTPTAFADFKRAALKIQAVGHIPVHTQVLPEGLTEASYMDIAFAMVRSCDGVYCLKTWRESSGAFAEVAYAKKLHLPVFHDVREIKKRFLF